MDVHNIHYNNNNNNNNNNVSESGTEDLCTDLCLIYSIYAAV